MKIVDVSGFYSDAGGGVKSYVRQKLEMAARAGHDLTVVAPGARDRVEARGGGKMVWLASPAMPLDANYRMFWDAVPVWRMLDAEAPDVVEGSSPWRGGWIAGHWPGPAVKSLVFHQDFVAGYAHTLMDGVVKRPAIDALFAPYWSYARRLSRRFEVTVTGGEWLARRLKAFGVANPVAVPFGIESGRFSPAWRDEALRAALLARCGVGPRGKLLLAVGRLHPEKRHRTIIEGFALAKAARGNLGLVLVGDGLTRRAVERLAAAAGNVHLAGAVDDGDTLAAIYASADALVHGSGAETYGLVVAEAIASGLPVVAPDTGGAADLAGQGPSAIYATGDSRACAQAILEFLGRDAPGGALITVGSAETHFQRLFELYEALVAARRLA